jgi:HK97 family phage portal protein
MFAGLRGWLTGGGQRADAGGDRSAYGNFWFEPIGMRSSSGLRITSGSAMRLSAVYSCVRVLAESFAILPFRLYTLNPDGSRKPIADHWLLRLMARPNQYQNGFEWREMMMGHLALRGNAFNLINVGAGFQIEQLVPVHPDRVTVQQKVNGDYSYVVQQLDGSTLTVPRGAMWHIRGLSSDGIVGLNPMEYAADVVGQGLAAQSFGARFFANNAQPGGWIEMPNKFNSKDERALFRDSWQAAQGGRNRGKTAVLEQGMKYHELTVNNSDSQFLELLQHTRSEIAGIFRVPPHKIGDLARATFSNIEQQSLDFINDGMLPWARRWENSIEVELLEEDDQGVIKVDFDFSVLLRGDMTARSAYYTANINNGSLTRNEARILEGRAPIDGLDEPLQMLNMAPAGTADQIQNPPAPPPPVPPAPPASPKKQKRMEGVVTGTASRIAHKEAEVVAKCAGDRERVVAVYAKHVAFVSNAMNLEDGVAAAYCAAQIALFDADPTRAADELEIIACARLAAIGLGDDPEPVNETANAMHRLTNQLAATPAPVINVAAPAVHVAGPVINLPEQPAAQISIAAPVVHVATPAPEIRVEVAAQAAPVVNVMTPEPVVNVSVAAPEVHVTNQAAAAPNVAVNVEAPKQQDKPWPLETTIKKRDDKGRADVIVTRPIE